MITRTRVTTMREFVIDRASRIYSVAAPALCLTVVCESLSRFFNAGRYGELAAPFSWSYVPLQLLTNLTFTAQCWGYESNPLTNSPFWSLSFECIYYLLFALLFFGAKRISVRAAVLVVMLIAGPSIVLLFPTWLLGCLLYDVYVRLDAKPYAVALASAMLAVMLGVAFVFRHRVGLLLNATDAPERSAWLAKIVPAGLQRIFVDNYGVLPWLSRFSLSYYAAAIVVFVVMLWALLTLDRFLPKVPQAFAASLRWIAEGTFSLYLLHVPLLMLIACVVPAADAHRYLWCCAVVGVCILLSQPFSRLKIAMRRGLHRAFPDPAVS
jgi:peptidoglycan/LPS O-acetylase OafA/YrhL